MGALRRYPFSSPGHRRCPLSPMGPVGPVGQGPASPPPQAQELSTAPAGWVRKVPLRESGWEAASSSTLTALGMGGWGGRGRVGVPKPPGACTFRGLEPLPDSEPRWCWVWLRCTEALALLEATEGLGITRAQWYGCKRIDPVGHREPWEAPGPGRACSESAFRRCR